MLQSRETYICTYYFLAIINIYIYEIDKYIIRIYAYKYVCAYCVHLCI